MDSDQGKLFIGGISWETTEEKLKEHFRVYGEVVEAVIMRDRATGRARGFGFVVFADPAVADTVALEKHTIDGRLVEAKRAVPRDEQQNVFRSNNGGPGPVIQTRTKKIFVGGLASTVTENDFRKYFEQFGTVTDVVVMYDQSTQRPRGFGFITFDSEDAVDNVLLKTFHELNGKMVEVKRAVPKELSAGPTRGVAGFGAGVGRGAAPAYGVGYGQSFNANPGGGYGARVDNRYGPLPGGRGGYPSSGAGGYNGGGGYGAPNGTNGNSGYGSNATYAGSGGYAGAGYGGTPGTNGYGNNSAGNSGYWSAPSRNPWSSGGTGFGSGGNSTGFPGTGGANNAAAYAGGGTGFGSGGNSTGFPGTGGANNAAAYAGGAVGTSPSQAPGTTAYGSNSYGYVGSDGGYGSSSTGYGSSSGGYTGRGSGFGSSVGGYGSAAGVGGSGSFTGYADAYGSSAFTDSTWKPGAADIHNPAGSGGQGTGGSVGTDGAANGSPAGYGGYGVAGRQSHRGVPA